MYNFVRGHLTQRHMHSGLISGYKGYLFENRTNTVRLIETFMNGIDPAYGFKFVCIAVVNDQFIVKE